MKTQWSKHWISSVQPRKQIKYVKKAPLHILRSLLSAHLSKELRTKYGKRNVPVRKEDTVKVVRGQFKGKTGKITKVDTKRQKIYVDGVFTVKKDGTKLPYAIHPSNLIITVLNIDDKMRRKALERK